MDLLRHQQLKGFLSKCENVLSHLKKKRRDNFIRYGDTQYNGHIQRILSLTNHVQDELRGIDAIEDDRTIDNLFNEYEILEMDTIDFHQELIDSLKREFENIDKEIWYDQNFDNWSKLPDRQECETYPLAQRLSYSICRQKMFDHLEKEWKKKTYPTLHDRLEFF